MVYDAQGVCHNLFQPQALYNAEDCVGSNSLFSSRDLACKPPPSKHTTCVTPHTVISAQSLVSPTSHRAFGWEMGCRLLVLSVRVPF